MEQTEIAALIESSAIAMDQKIQGLQWYVFGSSTKGKPLPNDYDVLVIYKEDADRAIVRESLNAFLMTFPIHLILMTPAEEQECQFVALQQARLIFG